MPEYTKISAEQLKDGIPSDALIIDVRSEMEHDEKRLKCAHHLIPLDELDPATFMKQNAIPKDAAIYLLCKGGKRASQAAEKFIAAGCQKVCVIDGGILACEACGHELEGYASNSVSSCGCLLGKPISLERQVRIASGAIVASGALLGMTTNHLFVLIPLFVGCGLVFAGVTDKCGMALLLTKAPWNDRKSKL